MRSLLFTLIITAGIGLYTWMGHSSVKTDRKTDRHPSSASKNCSEAAPVTITPEYDDGEVQSPGAGFLKEVLSQMGEGPYKSNFLLNQLHENLGRFYVRLDEFKDGADLTQSFLSNLNDAFASARKDGIKIVVRFSYNYPCQANSINNIPGPFKPEAAVCPQDQAKPYPWNDPQFKDASLETVLKHISQLQPIIRKNADVILAISGFVGRWGEQHHSTHDLSFSKAGVMTDAEVSAFTQIQKAQLNAYNGIVLIRNPWVRNILLEKSASVFSSDEISRLGIENDCFLASDKDAGTYLSNDPAGLQNEKNQLAQVGVKSMVSGETCHYNPPRSDCETALKELRELHYSFLTDGFPAAIFEQWKNQSCYEEIKKHLGYRFAIKNLTLVTSSHPGDTIHFNGTISNSGYANLYTSTPVYAVLTCGNWQSGNIPIDGLNASDWKVGDNSISGDFVIPETAPLGLCGLALNMPNSCDANTPDEVANQNCEQAKSNPRFSIQFANKNTWNAQKGFNSVANISLLANENQSCGSQSPEEPNQDESSQESSSQEEQ
jgi:hypothetical protein